MKEMMQEDPDNYDRTLPELKAYLRRNFNEGVRCPCCEQFVKIYKRRINCQMAKSLIDLYFMPGARNGKWYHRVDFKDDRFAGGGDFAKLRYWNLVEEKPNLEDVDKKCSGMWKITKDGMDFVVGRLQVPKYVHVYNTKVYDKSGDMIGITTALGTKFSYRELMNREELEGYGWT